MRTNAFGRLLPDSFRGSFLEVGIGEGGGFLRLLSKRGLTGLGIDYSAGAISRAKLRLKGKLSRRVGLRRADVRSFKGKFDLLLAIEVLEHCRDDEDILNHFHRLLNPGGLLFVSVPAHRRRWGPSDVIVGHVRRYEKEDLICLLKKTGFRQVEVFSYGFPLLNFSALVRNRWLEWRGYRHLTKNKSQVQKTKASSGRFLKTPLRFIFSDFFLQFFYRIQELFWKKDLGVGYLVRCRRP